MSTTKNKRHDHDGDGFVSLGDVTKSEKLYDLEMREQKADAQRRMAWVSMVSMIIYTAFLFSPLVSIERLQQLGDIMPLFYIAQAGIVGAFFGATAWMHSNTK
jgi:hypothetical protein